MRVERILAVVLAGILAPTVGSATPTQAATLPAYDHIVVLIEENHAGNEIIGSPSAPYLTSLASGGANMTQSFAVTHPSEPNYLALYSGSTQGLTDDSCPHTYTGENLGHQLITAGRTFTGYSESMPSDGYTGCDTRLSHTRHAICRSPDPRRRISSRTADVAQPHF